MTDLLRGRAFASLLASSSIALAAGCNATPTPASPTSSAPPTASSAIAAPLVGPGVAGVVTLSFTKQPPAGGGVVYLEDAPRQPGVAMSANVEVNHKEFLPLISVITTGGNVTFGNKEGLPHHVFSPDVKDWDTGLLLKGAPATKTFESAGVVTLLCNVHPEMVGFLVVVPSTYFSKYGADGKFGIGSVPAGTYKLTAWAPRMPTVTQSVTIGATDITTTNFELRPAS